MPIPYFKVKLNVCMSVYNTSHLLWRSLYTYYNQTMAKDEWYLTIVNDNSDDDVWAVVEPWMDKMNIEYIHLRHKDGPRGGMTAFNMMYKASYAPIIAETTPEILLAPQTFQMMYDLHEGKRNRFVTFKSYRLTSDIQLKIDMVDWKSNIYNISKIEGWDSEWVQQNVKKDKFRTHEISSYRKDDLLSMYGGNMILYGDYGSCDPGMSGMRETAGWEDYVVMDPMQIHQWHPPWHWRASMLPQKYHNKWAHTIENVYGDPRIYPTGTCQIWDEGKRDYYSEQDVKEWRDMDELVYKTGYVRLN